MDGEMQKVWWKFRISGKGFVYKGIWFCSAKRKQVNRRLIAFNHFGNWFAKDRERPEL